MHIRMSNCKPNGLFLLQLELQSQEMLTKHWRHLAKKEAKAAKAAKDAGTQHVPAAETPEATFIPLLLADFLKVGRHDILSCVPLLINLLLPSLGETSCN